MIGYLLLFGSTACIAGLVIVLGVDIELLNFWDDEIIYC